ncbi:8446_t:CDS:2, partial [Paraglomus brasilianum]
ENQTKTGTLCFNCKQKQRKELESELERLQEEQSADKEEMERLKNLIENIVTKGKKYAVRLVVYEPETGAVEEILKTIRFPNWNPLSGYNNLFETQTKINEIKEKLNSEHPILAVSENSSFPLKVIHKFSLPANINPEEHLRPLDIVWRKMADGFNYHAAIYLGNNQVAHISSDSTMLTDEKKLKNKLAARIDD